jgi:chaperonin cofactor prefoldin
MEKTYPPLNINTAERDQLTTLPGIGPALAERIIAGRPYTAPEDLKRVSGIGPASLEKFQGAIDVEDDLTPPVDPQIEAHKAEPPPPAAVEGPPSPVPPRSPEPQEPQEQSTPGEPSQENGAAPFDRKRYLTRSQTWWLVISSVLFSVILTTALFLGILVGVNGGLRYASQARTVTLEQQLQSSQQSIQELSDAQDDLGHRLETLESVSEQIQELESSLDDLQSDLQALSGQITTLQAESDTAQTFLKELRALLDALLSPKDDQ